MPRAIILGALILMFDQWGCAKMPPVGSLERLALEGRKQAAKDCYRAYSRRYPNVPTADVINGCRRAYGLTSTVRGHDGLGSWRAQW